VTTGPRLRLGPQLVSGLIAVALFVVLAVVFVDTPLPATGGFGDGVSVTANIGYALFGVDAGAADIRGESFLAAFLILALVLDAALEGGVMLARRERDGDVVTALAGDDDAKSQETTPPAGGDD
jgi:NADH:ubiquinone oxidoreductase subunit 6 (subunit J)